MLAKAALKEVAPVACLAFARKTSDSRDNRDKAGEPKLFQLSLASL